VLAEASAYIYVVHHRTTRLAMSAPISVRLDDKVRAELEAQARARKVGLSTLLREIATEAARQAKRKRIREQTKAVAEHIATHPEAQEFVEFWGTPHQEGL
jgi:post-segregation antitoxin (ccd killing protein)